MTHANPRRLPTAETLAPGLTSDSVRLTRSPPSTHHPICSRLMWLHP